MKKVFALPGILLPISLLLIDEFIGNSAFDMKMHGSYYKIMFSTNLFYAEFGIPLFTSWVLHIVLQYIKPSFQKWAWLQVAVSIICVFVFYFSLNAPMPGGPGGPRRYYDYDTWAIINFIRMNSAKLFLAFVTFYITQIAFWVYALIVLAKRLIIQRR